MWVEGDDIEGGSFGSVREPVHVQVDAERTQMNPFQLDRVAHGGDDLIPGRKINWLELLLELNQFSIEISEGGGWRRLRLLRLVQCLGTCSPQLSEGICDSSRHLADGRSPVPLLGLA